MTPKLPLRLKEQRHGVAADHHSFAERGGFGERGGSGEQPERNAGGAPMDVQCNAVAGRRARTEHRGDFPVALA